MIVKKEYSYNPRFHEWIYKPDGTILRNKMTALWYAYLKWREELCKDSKIMGTMVEAKYLFPSKEFPFVCNRIPYKFLPDFEISFYGINKKEYQSTTIINGSIAKRFRRLLHKHPFLEIRVIEPPEFKLIMSFMEDGGVNLKELIKHEE